jgi:hypothetical protein
MFHVMGENVDSNKPISTHEKQQCLDGFNKRMNNHLPIVVCAACGTRDVEDRRLTGVCVPLERLRCLALTPEEQRAYARYSPLQRSVRHVVSYCNNQGDAVYFHVAKEGLLDVPDPSAAAVFFDKG